MELRIYKGFDADFLSGLDCRPLVEEPPCKKLDPASFDVKLKKRLDAAVTLMDDDDVKWMTYEEFSLVHEKVVMAIKEYGLKAVCHVNNLWPDVYPLPFTLDELIYREMKTAEENESQDSLSEAARAVSDIYASVYCVDGAYFGSFFNYEYDKSSGIAREQRFPDAAPMSKQFKKADVNVFINDDIEGYLRAFLRLQRARPSSISIRDIGTRLSGRLASSLRAYCLFNGIEILEYREELAPATQLDEELTAMARDDLKIPDFEGFRKIRFYKCPESGNETVEISQATIIKEIIKQAESSYVDGPGHSFRDIFITASTGAGKSVMFQVPAVYLAKKHKKLTVIIEPVIALMEDQKQALLARGYDRVEAFNSNLITQVERDNVLRKVKDGQIDLLYLSPETLLSYSLETIVGDREIGLFIVDEAHIVTSWGVGFRPDYWYLGGYINRLRNQIQYGKAAKRKVRSFPICAFTATAVNGGIDDSVNETIISLYMENPVRYIGYVRRDDINFDISVRERERLGTSEYEEKKGKDLIRRVDDWIAAKEKTIVYFPYATYACYAYRGLHNFVGQQFPKGSVGIYTGKDTEGIGSEKYKVQKAETFEKFRKGDITVVFATKAFGMGVDVKDIKNVCHYAVTGNLCDYVQEIGRAARKEGMKGVASTDFYRNDISFMQRLFGMSQIRQYQIMKVLSGVYDAYLNKGRRSFLISPQSFTYIFSGKGTLGEDGAVNKLKTCLLMLEKDLYDKYNFKVLISRPQSVFTKAFVVVDRERADQVLSSNYGRFLKFAAKGRLNKPIPGTDWRVTDKGDVYTIDLKGVWEEYYPDLSFPQFKYWYFNSDSLAKDKIDVMPEIKGGIYPRQKIDVQTKDGFKLGKLKEKITEDIEYFCNTMYSTFGKTYFTLEDAAKAISPEYGMAKARIIVNSIFDLVDPNHKIVKPRGVGDSGAVAYCLANGTLKSHLLHTIGVSDIIRDFTGSEEENYSQFMSVAPDSKDAVALKILSVFDHVSYEIVGGEEPEIFVRLNDPLKIKGIVTGAVKYSNGYVKAAKEKHDRDVRVLLRFFLDLKTTEERWDFVERYFLGEDVLGETAGSQTGDFSDTDL